jgi:hypothetical protein
MQLGDVRKLDRKTQEALRHRAVLLVEKGATQMEAAFRWECTAARSAGGGGEAREGDDPLELRDRHPRPGSDRPGHSPEGQTPVLTQTRRKFSMSMIGAVSNRGLML